MPTGLTYKIYDGEDMSLRSFALTCVRHIGYGYKISNYGEKELPRDKYVPIKPSTYHVEQLKKAAEELEYWTKISPEEAHRLYDKFYAERDQENEDYKKRCDEIRSRYTAMRDKVETWDTGGKFDTLKDLMICQLNDSINHDCSTSVPNIAPKMPFDEWLNKKIEWAKEDIDYHKREYEKEIKSVNETNQYMEELYAELDKVDPVE
jgi:hypothetical protein